MTKGSSTSEFQPKPVHRKIVSWMWVILGVVIGTILLTFLVLSFTKLPTFDELENPIDTYASEVLAIDGSVIGRHFQQNRVQVQYDSLNPHVIKALIATEDERFLNHAGIDFKALGRVGFRTLVLRQKSSGGGSTITQQLAKLLFSDRDFSGMNKLFRSINLVIVKFKEWITAVKLERRYTKQEIIALYLNRCEYVHGAFGIQSAAETYFGKDQKDLNIQEAATLIGMLKNPALYNPMRRLEATQERRNVVIRQMVKNNFIDKQEADSLKNLVLDMSGFNRATHAEGIARYFLMESRKDVEKILDQPEYRKPDGSKYNIYRDGLKIYTSIDIKVQKYAEEAALEHMKVVQSRYNAEWSRLDPWTYQADAAQKELRQNSLISQMKSSDRYRSLRSLFMEEWFERVRESNGGLLLTDRDMEILIKAEKDPSAMEGGKAGDKTGQLKRILRQDYWPEMKEQWTSFVTEADKEFNTKIPMKIFAYNPPSYEKDTIMTPMDSIKYHRRIMQTGVLAVEPSTGQIRAWVGGVNYKYFQFDHIRSQRQVGSTFKPFIYAAAIANYGISPCFPVQDIQYSIVPGEGRFGLIAPWTPKNSEGKFTNQSMTLYSGLKNSVNSVSVYLMKQLGDTEPVRGMLHNMGIDSTERRNDGEYKVPKQPSIALGASDLSVMEMTGAYSTFANNGVFKRPHYILTIEDSYGKVIYRHVEEEIVALPSEANYVMVDLMKEAARAVYYGTNIKSEVGGKTGTTNDHVDGWFMGITPGLVVGTWVGGEERWIRFRSFSNGQGSRMARPIFAGLIKRLESDDTVDYDPNLRFMIPPEPRSIITDCSKYRNPHTSSQENKDDDDISKEFKLEEF
jgi:penicillin-binding protein 1A